MKRNVQVSRLRKIIGDFYSGRISLDDARTELVGIATQYSLELKAAGVSISEYAHALYKVSSRYDREVNSYGSLSEGIRNYWVKRQDSYGDSWKQVFIVDAETEYSACEFVEDHLFGGLLGSSINSMFDCTGRPFNNPAYARQVGKSLWLVTQSGGLDV